MFLGGKIRNDKVFNVFSQKRQNLRFPEKENRKNFFILLFQPALFELVGKNFGGEPNKFHRIRFHARTRLFIEKRHRAEAISARNDGHDDLRGKIRIAGNGDRNERSAVRFGSDVTFPLL